MREEEERVWGGRGSPGAGVRGRGERGDGALVADSPGVGEGASLREAGGGGAPGAGRGVDAGVGRRGSGAGPSRAAWDAPAGARRGRGEAQAEPWRSPFPGCRNSPQTRVVRVNSLEGGSRPECTWAGAGCKSPHSGRENSRWVRGRRGDGWGGGDGLPQASRGAPSSSRKEAWGRGVSVRPSEVPPDGAAGPARGPFSTVPDAAARGPGADDSPWRLITALNNFALDPGEAGVAAARESGCARARRGAARTHLRSCHPLSKLCCGDTPGAHCFVPCTRRVSVGAW